MYKKIIAPFFVLILLFIFNTPTAKAETLFFDDFESGTSKWNVLLGSWFIRDGKYGAAANNPSQNAVSIADVDITHENYVVELDMYPIRGIDRTIRFRRDSNAPGGEYDMHFTDNGIVGNFGQTSNYVLGNHPFEDNHSYHIKVVLEGQRFQFIIDNQIIFDFVDSNYVFNGHESFSLVVATGSVPTEAYFDNVHIYTDNQGLNVPLLKQTDPLWADDIYDSATLWQTNNEVTIGHLGCGITSAAMVFRYHGLTKMQDGLTELNPKSLNNLLNSMNDSHFRNGNTNWAALSRVSSQLASVNSVNFDALKYTRTKSQNQEILKNLLANGIPGILRVPGHFVVAKGHDETNNAILINDPYYDFINLSNYGNTYENIGFYQPVNSDLSYIVLVIDSNMNFILKNSIGEQVGEEYLEEPIEVPEGSSENTVGTLKAIYFPEPESGEYELTLSSPNGGTYTLNQYLYDVDGEVKVFNFEGALAAGQNQEYIITFDKDNSENSNSTKVVTYESLRQTIIDGYNQQKIKFGTHVALLALLNNSEKAKKPQIAQKMLDQMIHLISKDKNIAFDFAQDLIEDVNTLKNSF